MTNVTLFVMGPNGLAVLSEMLSTAREIIDFVVVGTDSGIQKDYSSSIRQLARKHEIKCFFRDDYPPANPNSYVVAVGWRWLIKHSPDRLIILHDSLLPKYRGFSPLVNMLINGEPEIGVTALFGTDDYDRGAIITQSSSEICYPITISQAIEANKSNYVKVIAFVIDKFLSGDEINGYPQIEDEATYSIWRDQDDYRIDWRQSAGQIKRFVDAVGHPYPGALTSTSHGEFLRILRVTVEKDVMCEQRHEGKIIFVQNGEPVVICGSGLLRVNEARLVEVDGEESDFSLKKFRIRFR